MVAIKSVAVVLAFTLSLAVVLVFLNSNSQGRTLLQKEDSINSLDKEPWNAFTFFMKKFNKTYSTIEEMKHRYKVFYQNFFWIKVQNQRNLNTKYGINHFADQSQEEFQGKYLRYTHIPLPVKYHQFSKNEEVLDSIDWEEKGGVNSPKDQGQCGSCWSFGATETLENLYWQKTGKLIRFSEQQLVDCSTTFGNNGCNGGMTSLAYEYWKQYGAETEEDYPYDQKDGICKYDASKVVFKPTGYEFVPQNEYALRQAVNKQTIAIAIDARKWSFYQSGIYEDECDDSYLNHAVTLIGYGTDNGQDYWKVRNEWSKNWGEDGNIRLKRTDSTTTVGQCGVARQAVYPTLS